MIVLACLILAVVLVITPVLLKMWIDTNRAEMRMERKLKDFERKIDERVNPGVDKSPSQ